MKKIKSKLNLITLILFFMSFLFISANILTVKSNAVDGNTINDVTTIDLENVDDSKPISGDDVLPVVTIDDAKDLVERKTFDVVELLQVFGKPFSVIMFILCAIVTLFGTITKSSAVGKGIFGMFITGIAYTGIMYAPEIMNFFSSWFAS